VVLILEYRVLCFHFTESCRNFAVLGYVTNAHQVKDVK
jgi:hypothetical protein